MTLLEREIIEKYHQLDSEAQKHILTDAYLIAPYSIIAYPNAPKTGTLYPCRNI